MEYSIPFGCLFGILTVFCSLIVIVILSTLMSAVIRAFERSKQPVPQTVAERP
ncbi:MAG: OadG family protein, partial [Oscillospiraceae bacterium]|nr:OadG family protein [Oscillospiraceae bacterium]